MRIGIVGTGLIGGSMAMVLRKKGFAEEVLGADANGQNLRTAMALGIIDKAMALEDLVLRSDVVLMCVPVNAIVHTLPAVMNLVDNQVVVDAGSTKGAIVQSICRHPKRGRFVAAHPMWGTEFSGPEAATDKAFEGKAVVICDKEQSDKDALYLAEKIFAALGMYTVYMDSLHHDEHVAYVSHISHVTSFALANTVLEKEKEEDAIFELASGGFESTVRLAKSNPEMWLPVLQQNKENVLDVLNEHIAQLRKFKAALEKENWEYLHELMRQANGIKRILNRENNIVSSQK
ncbi:MAG: prephenate dehydrogenase [Edaphocola sp.]